MGGVKFDVKSRNRCKNLRKVDFRVLKHGFGTRETKKTPQVDERRYKI